MISVFDRRDNFLFALDYITARHTEEINGDDRLTVATYASLTKGNKLVWADELGVWHEHIVDSIVKTHDSDGEPLNVATCLNSICDTLLDWIDEKAPTNATADAALATALEPTIWTVGTVNVQGTHSTRWYHKSARECIAAVVERWGGELQTDITVSGNQVTRRAVSLLVRRGSETTKRFTYSKDIISIKKTTESDDVITRLRGYGRGGDEGERRLDFAEINGGKDYIEDDSLLDIWGRPDGSGGLKHSEGVIIFSDEEDMQALLDQTRTAFEDLKNPRVSYTCDTYDLTQAGYEHEGTAIGDTVAIIDKEFNPELRLTGRVTRYERNVPKTLGENTEPKVTLGNIVHNMSDMYGSQAQKINSIISDSSRWDSAAYASSEWLNNFIANLNAEFEQGLSYKYEAPEIGIILSSVPLDDNYKPKSTPAKAMQLIGGGFRIANELNSDSSFKWRTFGDGDGFTADEINVGVIRGGGSYWNLETGNMFLENGTIRATATLGGKTMLVQMDATNGFGIWEVTGEGTYSYIGGLTVQNGQAVLRATVLGTSTSFIDVKPISGTVGMSFTVDGTESFRMQRGGRISGSTNIPGIWLQNPRAANPNQILLQDDGGVFVRNLTQG